MCTDCFYEDRHYIGDPTETAIAEAAERMGEHKIRLDEIMPRVDEIPFSSETKFMITVHKFEDGKKICIIKGAPERVLSKCGKIYDNVSIDRNITERI